MTRGAAYQAAYRLRSVVRGEVIAQGWEEMDTLLTFRKPDGEIVIVLKDGTRYSIAEPVEQTTGPDVQPWQVAATDFGPRWQRARESIGKKISKLDLSEQQRAAALAIFADMAALGLRGVELLSFYTGPDWREDIGLDSES